MRSIITLFFAVLMLASCGKSGVEKPDNLIEEKKMKEIIYDLSLLEAIKSQKPVALETSGVNANEYIYKKYKIDSLQFVKSNRYYASDIERYKKMYDDIAKRLENNKKEIDSLIKINGGMPSVPAQNEGVVK